MVRFCTYLAMALLAIGIAAGSRPASATGIAVDALRFDGGEGIIVEFQGFDLGDFVNIGHDPSLSLQDLTLEAWVFIESGSEFRRRVIMSKGREFGNYALSVRDDGAVEYVHRTATGNFSCCRGQVSVAFDEWTHVAASFDAITGEAAVYVNGQPVAQTTTTSLPIQNGENLFLGRADFASGEGVNSDFHLGLMDEVRIWNVVRTPAQILEFHNKVVGPSTLGLVANYHFDEGFFVPEEEEEVSALFFEEEFLLPVQEVFDSAAKPDLVDPNDGTLGLNDFADSDDPERVDSEAPLVGSVAECPVENTAALCPSGPEENTTNPFENSIVVFYNAEPAFSVGPARCTCPTADPENPITVEECSPDATGPNPCFPEGNEVLNATTLELITTDTNPTCKRVCFNIDGMRVCEKICN